VLFDYLEMWVPPDSIDGVVIPSRRPAPLEVAITDDLITIAGRDGLLQRDANERAALGWEALREYRQDFAQTFSVSNYAPLPAYLAAFDRAMGDAYDPARVVRIGVQAQRFVALSEDTEFMVRLPTGAAGDLRLFATQILVYLNRFPDWVAYRNDAEVVDAPESSDTDKDLQAIRDILNATLEATDDLKQEYAAEVKEGTGKNATEIEAKALVASTREIQRAIAEEVAARQKRNRNIAKVAGDKVNETVLAPFGMLPFIALKLEEPMRSLAAKGTPGMGWVPGWYDATFGKMEDRDR
jgi:hypothetical protein